MTLMSLEEQKLGEGVMKRAWEVGLPLSIYWPEDHMATIGCGFSMVGHTHP